MTHFAQAVAAQLQALTVSVHHSLRQVRRDERGSVTIEQVLWSIAAIAFVAIVVAVINSYLTDQAARIR